MPMWPKETMYAPAARLALVILLGGSLLQACGSSDPVTKKKIKTTTTTTTTSSNRLTGTVTNRNGDPAGNVLLSFSAVDDRGEILTTFLYAISANDGTFSFTSENELGSNLLVSAFLA